MASVEIYTQQFCPYCHWAKELLSRKGIGFDEIDVTGDTQALYKKRQPWIWAVCLISCGTILFFSIRKRKEKKVDAFQSDIG